MSDRISDTVSVHSRSPALVADAIETAVIIPTFKRPEHILRTVESVHKQGRNDRTAIIVVENEAEQQAGARSVGPLFQSGQHNGMVIVAHERGNCHAYNAGWSTAMSVFDNLTWIAVIDDDEIASPGWLEALKSIAYTHQADIVGGPQIPVFEGSPPQKWKQHPVFVPHYGATGPVETLYSSGNLLLRADVLRTMDSPRLDLAFNFTGGGDTDFLRRAKQAGHRLAWCNEAAVHETIPESRVTRDWIVKRALRNGELSARIEHRARAGERFGSVKTVAKSLALAAASLPRSALAFMRTGSLLGALYPLHIAAGRIASEFGYINEQYRNPAD